MVIQVIPAFILGRNVDRAACLHDSLGKGIDIGLVLYGSRLHLYGSCLLYRDCLLYRNGLLYGKCLHLRLYNLGLRLGLYRDKGSDLCFGVACSGQSCNNF